MNIPQSATRIVETGDRVRILVLGDRGVGKSSLIHMLCHQEPLRDARATTGFHIDVKVYEHQRKRCWIELLEVAGAGKHPMARRCLYAQKKVDGVILVHDPSNRRSYQHLWGWMSEATEAGAFGGGGTSSDSNINVLSTTVASPVLTTSTSNPYAMQRGNIQARRRGNSDMEVRITTEHSNQTPPVLLVGTMADRLEAMSSQHLSHPHGNTRPRRYSIVEEFDGDAVQLVSDSFN
ncbi:P-loop containing nucleoside triphosphate hydrolase protein [Syncephalis plumigaleata]|nr:P-loop containing nucleoside triphosphate hydrolase protein [Syncephalis plumigaleata]